MQKLQSEILINALSELVETYKRTVESITPFIENDTENKVFEQCDLIKSDIEILKTLLPKK